MEDSHIKQTEYRLLYPQKFYPIMQIYCNIFKNIFMVPLVNFGYERWNVDNKTGQNKFIGISSSPELIELFLETKAYKDLGSIDNAASSLNKRSDVITVSFAEESSNYNSFRQQMKDKLKINVTFIVQEQCMNYNQCFIWNFSLPQGKTITLGLKNKILLNYADHLSMITGCLNHFKLKHCQRMIEEIPAVSFTGMKQALPTPNENKKQLLQLLINDGVLTKKDLLLENISFSYITKRLANF